MSTITTRSGKGSPLTNSEVDSNFTNLNTDKAELSGATFTGEIVANGGIDVTGTVTADGLTVSTASVTTTVIEGTQAKLQFIETDTTDTNYQVRLNGGNLIFDVLTDAGAISGEVLRLDSTGIDVTGTAMMDGLTVNGEITGPATNNLTIRSKYSATIDIDSDNNQTDRNFQVIHDGSKLILKAEESGDISFYEDTGTTAKLVWSAANEDLNFADSVKATFGADDLQIYHDGSNSYISDVGTGNLNIQGNNLILEDPNGINFLGGNGSTGAVTLYSSGAARLATTSTGIDVTGSVVADGLTVDTSSVGGFKVTNEATSGVRLTAYQGTSNSNVRTAYVDAQEFVVSTGSPTGTSVTEKFRVKSTGIDVTGTVTADGFQTDIANTTTNLLARNSSNAAVYLQNGGTGDVLHVRSGNMSAGQGDLHLKVANNGDISFYEDTGTTPKFFWDASAEFLGIGTDTQTVNGESLRLVNGIFLNGGGTKDIPSLGLGDSNSGLFGSTFVAVTTNGQERFRVNTNGNVGIGTDSPAGKVTVKVNDENGNVTAWNNNYFLVSSGDSTISQALGMGVNTADEYAFLSSLQPGTAWKTLKYKALDHVFDGANDTERMRIDASGNVGIGTSSPAKPLEISSNASANSYIHSIVRPRIITLILRVLMTQQIHLR